MSQNPLKTDVYLLLLSRNLSYKRLQNEDLTLEIMSSDSLDPRRPCHRLRVNLKICLLQTDCCRIEKVSCFYLEPNLHKLQDTVMSYMLY